MANSQLYIWDDRFLWMGESFTANFTGRYAITLVVSLSSQPLRITPEGGEMLKTYALLSGPKVRRQLDARDTPFLSLNWDPHCYEFHALTRFLGNQELVCFEKKAVRPVLKEFKSALKDIPACGPVYRLCVDLFRCICPVDTTEELQDARVLRVASRLRQERPRHVDAASLAEEVGLSVDRLTHLFTGQLGMSMRNYLLWAKMRYAATQLLAGCNLTEVAHESGFSDSAHFTRTLREFYDVTPSFLTNETEVELHQCGR